jgi:hypothetical protein
MKKYQSKLKKSNMYYVNCVLVLLVPFLGEHGGTCITSMACVNINVIRTVGPFQRCFVCLLILEMFCLLPALLLVL